MSMFLVRHHDAGKAGHTSTLAPYILVGLDNDGLAEIVLCG